MSEQLNNQKGFTLIELVVAMTVFSFMLLIIVVGFMNVMRMHNSALASNHVQDNSRGAMEALVKGVRDSTAVISINGNPTSSLGDVLCLSTSTGSLQQGYWVRSVGTTRFLIRSDNCSVASPSNVVVLTNAQQVLVTNFKAERLVNGPGIVKPEVQLSLTVGSNNATTNGANAGETLSCNANYYDRAFCSVMTLKSGAVPR